ERVHLLDVLRRHPGGRVEVAHLPGDAGGIGAGVEMGDRADAATPVGDRVPGRGDVVAHGGDDAESGDDYAAAAHPVILVVFARRPVPGRKYEGPRSFRARPRMQRVAAARARGPAAGC